MRVFFRLLIMVMALVSSFWGTIAQNVSNVNATQDGQKIRITYDLDNAADISVFISLDDGFTFKQIYRVSGDVGKTVGPGQKVIEWDVMSEMKKGLTCDSIRFKVRVDADAEAAWRKQHRQEIKDEKCENRLNLPMPYSTFFTLNTAYSPQPQWSCGFKLGGMKVIGWFVSVMTGFHFNGMYHPFEDGQVYALNGNNKSIRFSAQAGVVMQFCKPVSMMIGAGYGYRTLACQTTNHSWYCYPKRTYQGVDASLGFLFNIKGFAISAEAVTTNFKTIEARIGLGVCLPKTHAKKDN